MGGEEGKEEEGAAEGEAEGGMEVVIGGVLEEGDGIRSKFVASVLEVMLCVFVVMLSSCCPLATFLCS
jgi:hypothetical protein